MGIRLTCPNGHKLHVKSHLAGKRGICPQCGAKVVIPDVQPSEAISIPTAVAAGHSESLLPTEPNELSEIGSQSVVISLAESSIVHEGSASGPVIPGPAPIEPQGIQTAAPPMPVLSLDSKETSTPEQPVATLRRQRRQKQLLMTVGLFAIVVVLGIVLILVLTRGPHASSNPEAPTLPSLPTAEQSP